MRQELAPVSLDTLALCSSGIPRAERSPEVDLVAEQHADAGSGDLFDAYTVARGWQDSAAMVAEECLASICAQVTSGAVSLRDAARKTGLPKSTLARIMTKAEQGSLGRDLTPYMRPEFYEHIYADVWSAEGEAPFEKVEREGIGASIVWR